jgi:hypothetical protein
MTMRLRTAAAVLLLLAGCSGGGGEPLYLNPPAGACSADGTLGSVVPSAPLEADFRPVSAVRCVVGLAFVTTPPTGSPAGPTGSPAGPAGRRLARSDGPFDALVAALRTPPPTHSGGDLICTLQYEVPVFVALTDATGLTVVPAVPATPCGFRLPEVNAAIDAMTWVPITGP